MHVTETRANQSGIRRRRACLASGCDGRVTTQEIAMRVGHTGRGGQPLMESEHILVSRTDWDELAALTTRIQESAHTQLAYHLATGIPGSVRPDDDTAVDAASQGPDDAAPGVPADAEHSDPAEGGGAV